MYSMISVISPKIHFIPHDFTQVIIMLDLLRLFLSNYPGFESAAVRHFTTTTFQPINKHGFCHCFGFQIVCMLHRHLIFDGNLP